MDALKSYCQALINQMDDELLNIRLEYPESDRWAQISVQIIEVYLDELKTYITLHPFKKRSEEIYFFKYVKPEVLGRLIFMCEVHNTDVNRPLTDNAQQKDFFTDEVDDILKYFDRYKHLYEYYKEDLDVLDAKYFVRNPDDRFTMRELPIEVDPVYFYSDREFSTGFDYAFAKIRALERLKDYLENEFEALVLVGYEIPPTKLKFTGSNADLVSMVEMFNKIGMPSNPETGKPYTDEEIFQRLKGSLIADIPDGIDFETLKLISGNSDLPERMLDALDQLQNKWDKEEGDVDYDNPDRDKPKG